MYRNKTDPPSDYVHTYFRGISGLEMGSLDSDEEERFIFPEENQSPTHSQSEATSRYDQTRLEYQNLSTRFENLLREHKQILKETDLVQDARWIVMHHFIADEDEADKRNVQAHRLNNRLKLLQFQKQELLIRLKETETEFKMASEVLERVIREESLQHRRKMERERSVQQQLTDSKSKESQS